MKAKEKRRLRYSGSKQLTDNVYLPGKEIENPMSLLKCPVSDKAAVSKNCVNELVQTDIDSNRIKLGIFNPQVIPDYTGGLITINTQNEGLKYHIANNCVPGTYTKVTVNHTGLITGGSTLTPNQIPNLSWGKITTDKPTTLSGYGITDGLSKRGGVLTGTLVPVTPPTHPTNLVNKLYVDTNKPTIDTLDPRAVGDIVRRTTSETTTYLRCNGGLLSINSYPELYSVIGEKYSTPYVDRGSPWNSYFDLQLPAEGNFTPWTTSTRLLAAARADFSALVTKNRIIVVGGMSTTTSYRANVYSTVVDTNGLIASFSTDTSFPTNITGNSLILYNSSAYSFGGRRALNNHTNAIYRTSILSNDKLTSWTLISYLPLSVSDFCVTVTRNRLVMIGGLLSSTSHTADTYSASISTAGVIGAWEPGPALPTPLSNFDHCVIGDSVYIIGGITQTGYSDNIYRGKYDTEGRITDWEIAVKLPQSLARAKVITTKDKLIIFGGYNGAALNTVISYDITDTFSLTNRTNLPNLPFTWYSGDVVIVKNFIYLIGGIVNDNYSQTLYRTPIIGGISDYSPWYSNAVTPTPVGFFNLPDYSALSQNGLDYFIKAV